MAHILGNTVVFFIIFSIVFLPLRRVNTLAVIDTFAFLAASVGASRSSALFIALVSDDGVFWRELMTIFTVGLVLFGKSFLLRSLVHVVRVRPHV